MTADQCSKCAHYLPTVDGLCSMCRPKPDALAKPSAQQDQPTGARVLLRGPIVDRPTGTPADNRGEPVTTARAACNCDQARELAAQIKWRDKTIANQSAELARVTAERDALHDTRWLDTYNAALTGLIVREKWNPEDYANMATKHADAAHGKRGTT